MKSNNEPCYSIISWKPTGDPGLLLPPHSMVINIDRNHHTFQIELQYALLPKALEKEHHIYCPEQHYTPSHQSKKLTLHQRK